MNDLAFYFKEGWQHIISKDALDHQLFLLALCALYLINDWRKLLILITAFTIGHSVTLALSICDVVRINTKLVEFLVPCTIIITAVFNFFQINKTRKTIMLNYFFALFFGLIHGLGFANTIRFMMAKDESLGISLAGFNLGLEAGQILIVIVLMACCFLAVNILKLKRNWWVIAVSSITLLLSIRFAVDRFPWH
jgi:hypothetical protein